MRRFAQLVASGNSQTDAYKTAYRARPDIRPKLAWEAASVIASHPLVIEEIKRLRSKVEIKTLLSLNDRLAILAKDAQIPSEAPAMVNARARVIEVYSKISGDQAPQRVELTGKDGQAIATTAEVNATVRVTKRDKIAAILGAAGKGAPAVIPAIP